VAVLKKLYANECTGEPSCPSKSGSKSCPPSIGGQPGAPPDNSGPPPPLYNDCEKRISLVCALWVKGSGVGTDGIYHGSDETWCVVYGTWLSACDPP
ncbi:MAG: hypothetical protein L0H70_04525, partial [Xanthomonadales bacterium]|nr:hypothetical protein [Xanthomonadales bacterium]